LTGNFYMAGYLVTLFSFTGSYFLLYKLTGSKFSFLPLIFPPILLNLASLIDTELPFIFLVILVYWFLKNKRFTLAFLILGFSVWFRIAGLAILAGIFAYMAFKKELGKFFLNLPYFMLPIVLLLAYNVYCFGSNSSFYQLVAYEALHPGRISIGIVQLAQDLARAFRWHWYRIFFSGLFYIFFFLALWIKSIKVKNLEFWLITGIYVFTLSINLVPFLENLGRYLAPTVPFFWLIFYKKVKSRLLALALLSVSVLVVFI